MIQFKDFYSDLQPNKKVISEAAMSFEAMRNHIVDKIGDKVGLGKMGTDTNFAHTSNKSAEEIAKEIEKVLGTSVKVIEPGEKAEHTNGKLKRISSKFKGFHFEYDGKLYNFKLSSASSTGGSKRPRDAAFYEMGICVEYNKLQGMDRLEAMKKADVEEDKYSSYEEHLTKVCEPVAKGLPNMGPFLRQTGGDTYTPASVWPSSDGTPKTDIFGGGAHRVSVKKKGGSQLMSGTSGDAQGVFLGAIGFYERYSKQTIKDMKRIVDAIENEFVNLNTDRTVTEVKKDVEQAYIDWRTPQVKESARNLKIKASDRKVKRHVRAELKAVGIIDRGGKWEDWFIEEIQPLSERSILKWFESYWKSQATDALKEEVRDVITAGISHTKLDDEFKKIFENKEFKTWCVYEAASGNFKFSGDNDINASLDPIANEILVFGLGGDVKTEKVDADWSKQYANKVSVQVGFKTSGRGKATAFRLTSEAVNYDELSQFEIDTNRIINEEIKKINEDVEELFESYNRELSTLNELSLKNMIRKLKDAGRRLLDSIQNKIKMFYNNTIKKVLNNIYKMAKEGIRKFAEYLGIDIDGKVSMKVTF